MVVSFVLNSSTFSLRLQPFVSFQSAGDCAVALYRSKKVLSHYLWRQGMVGGAVCLASMRPS